MARLIVVSLHVNLYVYGARQIWIFAGTFLPCTWEFPLGVQMTEIPGIVISDSSIFLRNAKGLGFVE